MDEARRVYLSNYEVGWRCGNISRFTIGEFRHWLQNVDKSCPVADTLQSVRWPVGKSILVLVSKAGYDANQPRAPKGQGGGRWEDPEQATRDARLIALWDHVTNGGPAPSRLEVEWKRVRPREAQIVRSQTGVKITGYRHFVKKDDLVHINKTHGAAGVRTRAGQLPITHLDLQRLKNVVAKPDTVEAQVGRYKTWKKATAEEVERAPNEGKEVRLVYTRTIGEKRSLVALFSRRRKRLTLVTCYKTRAR